MKKRFVIGIMLAAGLLNASAVGLDPVSESGKIEIVGKLIQDVEGTVRAICRDADAGKFSGGKAKSFGGNYDWLPTATLSFEKGSFEKDVDAAVAYLDKLETLRRNIQAAAKDNTRSGGAQAASRGASPEDALMRAESAVADPSAGEGSEDITFSVLDSYSGDRKAKQAEKDRMAELDMKRVAEERRLAEMENQSVEDAKRRTIEQNARWQGELDLQATKTAAEEEAWRRAHSAGAFFKNLARTAVGGTVSAFTGGIAQSVGSGMADVILRKRFDGFRPSGEYDRRYNDSSNNQPAQ